MAGLQILVVEDEYYLADDIARMLRSSGANVLGPCGDLSDATAVLDSGVAIDAAILDVNLRSELVYPVASELRSRNIPFIFASGYERGMLPEEFSQTILLEKPLDPAAVTRALQRLLAKSDDTTVKA